MTTPEPEYQVTCQRAADDFDARGEQTFEGGNFSNLVEVARRAGYPRVVAAQQRTVTPWEPVTYNYAERTP